MEDVPDYPDSQGASNLVLPKFNDGFYRVTLQVMVLSDNNPLEWDYRALNKEVLKQADKGEYILDVVKVSE